MRTLPLRPVRRFRPSPLIAAFAAAFGSTVAIGATFTVSTAADSLTGSLREAITLANAACATAPHVIQFAAPFTIAPSSELPTLGCAIEVNAGGQAVEIVGSLAYGGICGVRGNSSAARIVGLKVHDFATYGGFGLCGLLQAEGNELYNNVKGIYLTGAPGSVVSNNDIHDNDYGIYDEAGGSSITGNQVADNFSVGYYGFADNVSVTGNTVERSGQGIYAFANGVAVSGNIVQDNLFGGIQTGTGATISNNVVSGATSGIGIYANDGTSITGNTVSGNSAGIEAYSGSTIQDNTVSGNAGTGIYLYDGGTIQGNRVFGNQTNISAQAGRVSALPLFIADNFVGTEDGIEVSGTNQFGLGAFGSDITVTNNVVIGHASSAMGISVEFTDGGLAGTGLVSGNRIGINLNGEARPNLQGLEIFSYGGPLEVSGNFIAGNVDRGITLFSSELVTLRGNMVGTDPTGTVAMGNGQGGIAVNCSRNLTITGNVVSNNGGVGALMLDGVTQSVVSANKVGTDISGTAPLGNTGGGIWVESSDCFSPPPPPALTAPKAAASKVVSLANNVFQDNVVAYNIGDGFLVYGGLGNTILGGSIHSNGGKNINLDVSGGATPQDPDPVDGTAGPNNRQNYPVIVSALGDSGNTVVDFTLSSTPLTTFDVQFYSNVQGGVAAGETYVDVVSVTTDASGAAAGSYSLAGVRTNVTATATGSFGTSEFSPPIVPLVPSASILPMSVSFGNVVVGATASNGTTIEFRSNGTGDYVIDSITEGASAPACPGTPAPPPFCASGDFSCNVSCTVGTAYPPLAGPTSPPSCTVSGLSFHPIAAGAQAKTLWICDNASASPRAITLTGTGTPHVVTTSQSSHDFGDVSLGTQGLSPNITITNAAGNPPAMLGAPMVAAPFTVDSNDCGSTLASGATCNLKLAFVPTAVGAASGSFTMSVANGNPIAIALFGAGISTAIGQLLIPGGVDLGSAVLASSPLQSTAQLMNTGNAPVTFTSIAASAPFTLAHDCGASLAPGATCTATVGFDPLVYGTTTGQLTVASDASGSPHVATLLATVNQVAYGISPLASNYGSVPVGSSSPPRAFIISNNGDRPIPLLEVSTSGPFGVAEHDCGSELGPRSSCTAQVTFDPAQAGSATGQVAAQIGLSNAPPAAAQLSGNGTQQAALSLPDEIDFGAVVLGSVEAVTRTLELRNTGNAVLTFSTSAEGAFVLSPGNCGLNLAPGAACQLVLTFMPAAVGSFEGTLTVVSNAPGGSRVIALRARVQPRLAPLIRVNPLSVGFGDRGLGGQSENQRITVTNEGGLEASALRIELPPGYVFSNNQCGTTLAPGTACTVDFRFQPFHVGPHPGSAAVFSNASGSPHRVDVLGRGCLPFSVVRRGHRPSCGD